MKQVPAGVKEIITIGLRTTVGGIRQRTALLAISLFSFAFFCPAFSMGQLSTASLNGTVKEQTGAVVANATILLTNVGTSVVNKSTSNQDGEYTFVNITPGEYSLEADATGFSSSRVPPFTLTVSQTATINFQLVVGTQSTVITVEGTTAQLDVSSANLGTVIATQQVNDLPLNGRNFTQLLALTPGVSTTSVSQNNSHGIGGSFNVPAAAANSSLNFPAVNGQTNRSNLFLTDGLFNTGTLLSTYAVPPIIDAIQEFKVVSHTDSAEFGSVTGGVVNVVTKSGTNNFHGSLWSYYRDQIFDARTYFLPVGTPKTPFHQNQFGGAIGGPVEIPKLYNGKNKTFFFGAYQGFRYSQTSNTLLRVPTAAELAGDESDLLALAVPQQIYNPFSTRLVGTQYVRDPFPGNQIPANLIDPRIVAYSKFVFPTAGPTLDSAGDNALDTTPTTQTQNEYTIRVDQTIGSKDSAWFRYSTFRSTAHTSGGLPSLVQLTTTPATNWGISYVHTFNPSLIVQGLFAHTNLQDNASTRFRESTAGIYSEAGFSDSFAGDFLAANGGNLIPSPGINGYTSAGESIQNEPRETDSWQYSGSLTKTVGNHTLQAGAGYVTSGFLSPIGYANLGFTSQNTGDPSNPANTGGAMASFVLNVPNSATRRNVNETERPGGVFGGYFQDSWKALPKLTVNIGMRYDLTFIPPYGTNATIGQQGGIETGDVDFGNGTYVLQKLPPACSVRGHAPCIPGDGSLPDHVVLDPRGKIAHDVYTNLGPRFGFAYQLDDNTVVRGAFGIVYDNWAGVTQTAQNYEGSWPDIGQQIVNNANQPSAASATPTITSQAPFGTGASSLLPAATPFNQVQYFFDPHIKNAYSEQFNFGVGRQVNRTTTLSLNYVGSLGRRLDVGGYYNTALQPSPTAFNQANTLYPYIAPTYYDRSAGSSSYHALQFSLDRRFSSGYSYQVAYTYSKSIDVGGDGFFGVEGGVPQDPYDPSAFGSRSVAGTDLTHILAVNSVYQVPIGKGKRFSTGNRIADYALGNWQINNIFSAHSGVPFTPMTSGDIANTGNGGTYETLNRVGDPNAVHKSKAEWFNIAAYATPPSGTYGNVSRNALRTQAYYDLDTSVFRQFPVSEGKYFEFRLESFNLLNNVVLGTPGNDITSGTFGAINTTNNTARQLQLAAKFVF